MGADALRVAREVARNRDPDEMARHGGGAFDRAIGRATLSVPLLGAVVGFSWPELELRDGSPALPEHVQALTLYYLARTDGTPPSGSIVSFADLPDGRFYAQAFRGYTGAVLARRFAGHSDELVASADAVGGRMIDGVAERAWRFDGLPNVPVTLAWWDSDDEFDARAELMFDATAPHHLTTDGCAVLGSWLTSALVGAADARTGTEGE